jgi:hypothetical protein
MASHAFKLEKLGFKNLFGKLLYSKEQHAFPLLKVKEYIPVTILRRFNPLYCKY